MQHDCTGSPLTGAGAELVSDVGGYGNMAGASTTIIKDIIARKHARKHPLSLGIQLGQGLAARKHELRTANYLKT